MGEAHPRTAGGHVVTASAPHIPWSDEQRKKLCCLLKERGLWDDRHAVCGVASLSDLTRDQAHELIQRLADDGPRRASRLPTIAARRAYHGPRHAGGVVKPATAAQRALLSNLKSEILTLGEPSHVLDGRLWSQFRYRDGCALSTFTASQIVQALLAWKSNLLRRTAAPSIPRSLDPLIPAPEPVPF